MKQFLEQLKYGLMSEKRQVRFGVAWERLRRKKQGGWKLAVEGQRTFQAEVGCCCCRVSEDDIRIDDWDQGWSFLFGYVKGRLSDLPSITNLVVDGP